MQGSPAWSSAVEQSSRHETQGHPVSTPMGSSGWKGGATFSKPKCKWCGWCFIGFYAQSLAPLMIQSTQTRPQWYSRSQGGRWSCLRSHKAWAQKQRWACWAEGLRNASNVDHFAATSAANPLLGKGVPTMMLPEVIFNIKHLPGAVRTDVLLVADRNPSFCRSFAQVYWVGVTQMDGGQAHLGVD